MISYSPLFITLKKKEISQYKLVHMGVDNKTMHKFRHNIPVSLKVINDVCLILECNPNDIVEIMRDEEELAKLQKRKKPSKYPRPR